MSTFRADRERAKRYCYGRQWDDLIEADGRIMKEEDYIRSRGNVPLKNNLIRRLVRSVLGVFRNQYAFPSPASLGLDPDSPASRLLYDRLRRNADLNSLPELLARTMEEFLISGLAVHRKSSSRTSPLHMPGVAAPEPFLRTDYVAPDSFFVDAAARDFRGWDIRIIGQTHDIPFSTLCAAMARSRADVARFRDIFASASSPSFLSSLSGFGSPASSSLRSFYTPPSPDLCRVIEVWTRDSQERLRVHDLRSGRVFITTTAHASRLQADPHLRLSWHMADTWHYHFFAPTGETLAEGKSPLPGGGHPYVWKAYPFIDGEIHSFVADVIDQQRHTNRLITLYDWVLRSTAKGVLLFPETALPEGVDINDISDQWSRFNGVILFRPKAGMPIPQQVTGSASKVGITDLLNIQLNMFEDVSGVSGALEGKLASGAVSGKLYDQQTRQAMIALQDILDSVNVFIQDSLHRDLTLLNNQP